MPKKSLTSKNVQNLLANSAWLQAMGKDFTHELLNGARRVRIPKGVHVYALHDTDQAIYGIVSGAVGIQIDDRETGIMLGHVLGRGAWFGEAAAITGQPRQVGTVALTECTLVQVSHAYLRFLEQHSQPVWRALAALAVMNGALGIRVARDLMLIESRSRCISTLCRIAEAFEPNRAIPLTQSQLAEACRLSRSAFAKLVAGFENEGLIQRKYGHLIVHAR